MSSHSLVQKELNVVDICISLPFLVVALTYLSYSSHSRGTVPLNCQSIANESTWIWMPTRLQLMQPHSMTTCCLHGSTPLSGCASGKQLRSLPVPWTPTSHTWQPRTRRWASHVADKTSIQLLQANQSPSSCLNTLNDDIFHKNPYEHLFVAEYAPSDPWEKYRYVQELQKGLCRPCVLCTCSIGGPVSNYLFVWPIPKHATMEAALSENQNIISQIQADVLVHHQDYFQIWETLSQDKFGKPQRVLPSSYRWSDCQSGEEIDARLHEALEMEDPDLIINLRAQNKGHIVIGLLCSGKKWEVL